MSGTTIVIVVLLFMTCVFGGSSLYLAKEIRAEEHSHYISNKKRNDELAGLKRENRKLEGSVRRFESLLEYLDETPGDCKAGKWCGACEFAKHMDLYLGDGYYETYWHCGKDEICKCFVKRRDGNGD